MDEVANADVQASMRTDATSGDVNNITDVRDFSYLKGGVNPHFQISTK